MGTKLVALFRAQRGFKQGAENTGIHITPIKTGGLVEQFYFAL
jgi:hypothetical protein